MNPPGDLSALNSRLRIVGCLSLQTAMHIGTQRSLEVTGTDLPVVRDASGRPFIPGSAFKGLFRSNIEALVRGLGNRPGEGLWSCDPLEEPCIQDRGRSDADLEMSQIIEQSCDLCLLFGNTSIASRILIKDMLPLDEDDAVLQTEVRDHVAIDRDTETAKDGLKFDKEVVSAGARFGFEVVLDNHSDAQLGLFFAGLDVLNRGLTSLGGAGSRGLGRVEIEIRQVEKFDAIGILTGQEPDSVQWQDLQALGRRALAESIGG